jgi:uncharacterized protein (DUF1778 family)
MARAERIEARLSSSERRRIRRAAEFEGQSLSSFIVEAAVERADRVIESQTVTTLPADYFDKVVSALDRAGPAPRLARAAKVIRRKQRIG